MSAYIVHFVTPASTSVRIEADDAEEAVDKACDEVYVSLCHQCAGELDLAGEWEPEAVIDEAGELAWERES